MAQRLMVIGAGHDQVPAILLGREMGFEVVTTDMNDKAPGIAFANYFENVSTSDKKGNLAVAKRYSIDGVMTLVSETAVPVVAFIASQMSLPGISERTALLATNKNAMRNSFLLNKVPSPHSLKVEKMEDILHFVSCFGFPLVLKPSDCSGQRGVFRIENENKLEEFFVNSVKFASDKKAIIETFCIGPEINVTAIVQSEEIHFLSFSNRIIAEPPSFGIALEHISPPDIEETVQDEIQQACIKAIRAIELTDGIAYPQVIVMPEGPKIIEIAARIPGGFMREVALYRSGIDLVEIAILQAMGEPMPLIKCKKHKTFPAVSVKFLTELNYPNRGNLIRSISGIEMARSSKNVLLYSFHLNEKDYMPTLNSSAARFGAIITWGKTREEASKLSKEATNFIRINFEDD